MGVPGVERAEQTEPSGNGHVGRALLRKEDPRLITGRATYTDDLVLPGMLYVSIVRSPEAHAKIVSIDTSEVPEGVKVFTHDDLDMETALPMAWVPPGIEVKTPDHWVLAKGEVKHVGDPVALVVGDDRYGVIDAAEAVVVEYDPLPVVTDPEAALEDGSPLVHEQFGTNKICEWSLGGGDLDAGFAEADVIIERRVVNHRIAGGAIEPRGVLAEFRADRLTVYSSTQVPHFLRLFLSLILGISEERVRVVAPEVGGAFGSKLNIYAEEIGFLGPQLVAAHSTLVSSEEMDILARTGTQVSYNPVSNCYCGLGIAPIVPMLELGIDVSLAVDGASVNSQNMIESLKFGALLQKVGYEDPQALNARDMLAMATIAGSIRVMEPL